MLVISRKPGERFIIKTESGERIEVVIHRVNGNCVRIGIEAPNDVRIIRSELDEERAA
jgi:carbon storage regulator